MYYVVVHSRFKEFSIVEQCSQKNVGHEHSKHTIPELYDLLEKQWNCCGKIAQIQNMVVYYLCYEHQGHTHWPSPSICYRLPQFCTADQW